MTKFSIDTNRHTEFVNINAAIQEAVSEARIKDGVVTVFVPHTTAGITINENGDPDVVADIIASLEKQVPWRDGYKHTEGNAAAHVKASLMGSSVRLLVEGGLLRLGTWQSVYLCEFDGPRQREIWAY